MALIKCPECDLQVSSTAFMCPHCGYVLNKKQVQKLQQKTNRKKRLPNGFGQITKLKNPNLRKPYRAMVTVGRTKHGKYITKLLKPESYFETYNDAYAALVEYHKNPYDINKDITVKELYERWSVEYFKTLKNDSSVRNITNAWSYTSSIYDMKIADVRIRHIKNCIKNAYVDKNGVKKEASPNVKKRMKSLFNALFDYALEYDLTDKNYARLYNLDKNIKKEANQIKKEHIDFTSEEIELLWNNLYIIDYVDVLLIQCYGGWRPQEIGLIELKNVDIDNWFIKGGIKTDAGEDRLVPVHPKIRELVRKRYDEAISIGSNYLINVVDGRKCASGYKLTYNRYSQRFNKIIETLNMNPNHRCHDGRIHFITKAKEFKVDEYAIKYIVGHSIDDLTEDRYTKRKPEWLMEEIEKIK